MHSSEFGFMHGFLKNEFGIIINFKNGFHAFHARLYKIKIKTNLFMPCNQYKNYLRTDGWGGGSKALQKRENDTHGIRGIASSN